jgi:intraflagellar transport protein 52
MLPPFSPIKLPSASTGFLFVDGCSLSLSRPSVYLMSTGYESIPLNQAICALSGRVLVFGSFNSFTDSFIDKEQNSILFEALFKTLINPPTLPPDNLSDLSNYFHVSNLFSICSMPRIALEEPEELDEDVTNYFSNTLYQLDGRHIGDILHLYKELSVPRDSLKIQPRLESSLPDLHMAVYSPEINNCVPPLLELFDFDQEFASSQTKLAQLANKCNNSDLSYFIYECGKICSIPATDPKTVLVEALKSIVKNKLSTV